MSATNQTNFLALPQFTVVDKPSWVGDFNCAMEKIDTGVSKNATGVTEAKQAAATADAKAVAAQTTANNATTLANQGISAAAKAQATADLAHTTADGAVTSINTVSENVKTLENKVDERFAEYDATFQETGESITKIEGQIANISVPNFSDSVEITPTFYPSTTSKQGSANAIGNMLYIAITFTLTDPITPTTPASSKEICAIFLPESYSFESKYAIFKVPYLDNGDVKTEFSIYPKYSNSISIFSNNMAIEAGHEIKVYAYIPLVPKEKP